MIYMTNKIIAIQGNHPSQLIPKSDTSVFLAIEAQKKNYRIFYYEPNNLSIINDKVLAKGFFINFNYRICFFKYYSVVNSFYFFFRDMFKPMIFYAVRDGQNFTRISINYFST